VFVVIESVYLSPIENPCVPGSIPGRATIKYLGPSIFKCWGFFIGSTQIEVINLGILPTSYDT
jgi:hypothetical protein